MLTCIGPVNTDAETRSRLETIAKDITSYSIRRSIQQTCAAVWKIHCRAVSLPLNYLEHHATFPKIYLMALQSLLMIFSRHVSVVELQTTQHIIALHGHTANA